MGEALRKEFPWLNKKDDDEQKKSEDDSKSPGKEKNKDKNTLNWKKGDDEEDAPEGEDF